MRGFALKGGNKHVHRGHGVQLQHRIQGLGRVYRFWMLVDVIKTRDNSLPLSSITRVLTPLYGATDLVLPTAMILLPLMARSVARSPCFASVMIVAPLRIRSACWEKTLNGTKNISKINSRLFKQEGTRAKSKVRLD